MSTTTTLRPREAPTAAPGYDVHKVREDFPILATRMNDRPLVYLDTAASAQKPRVVIETLKSFYERDYANIHRGVYDLSQRATAAHDEARRKVQRFLNAADWREIGIAAVHFASAPGVFGDREVTIIATDFGARA